MALQLGDSVTTTLNIRLQNNKIPKEIFAASSKEERRKLATTNSDLVAKYPHAFLRFIKSVDFYKLQ